MPELDSKAPMIKVDAREDTIFVRKCLDQQRISKLSYWEYVKEYMWGPAGVSQK